MKDHPDCETGDGLDASIIKMMQGAGLVNRESYTSCSSSDLPHYGDLFITLAGERELEKLSISIWGKRFKMAAIVVGSISIGVLPPIASSILTDLYNKTFSAYPEAKIQEPSPKITEQSLSSSIWTMVSVMR